MGLHVPTYHMPPTTCQENANLIRRPLTIALVSLIPLVYAAAFLTVTWFRSEQGHGENVYPSEIQALAVRREPADPLADSRARGSKVYRQYCQICHGERGKGDGFNSSRLKPPPRDFTDAKFWREESQEIAYRAVSQGGPSVGKSVLMPAWGHTLTDRQIRDVLTFTRAFAAKPKAQGEKR
jgi:cytochrome c oxidase cbb3-type subunit 3